MASTIAIAALVICVYWVASPILSLLKNISSAKASGLPYRVSPIGSFNLLWMLTHKLWLPLINRLPKSWTEDWLFFTLPDWVWTNQFEPFKEIGDIFLTVSPSGIHIYLANAEAIRQVTSHREAFPKPLDYYKLLDIFGRNVVSTEGAEWKLHRRITSPGFNEKNNALVFRESCKQAQGMLSKWTGGNDLGNITIREVPTDTMRLALHIISRVGFGVRLLWPGENSDEEDTEGCAVYGSNDIPEGHSMSFEHALESLLANLIWIILAPRWLLKWLPFAGARIAHSSFQNWGQYMTELFQQKLEEAHDDAETQGMDIMGSLVRNSYGTNAEKKPSSSAANPTLSDSDILGNAFVMIVAGHETTANSIHFSLMELAINPRSQRLVQEEVTTIVGTAPPSEWEYESTINSLLGGIVGAVLNEELRLMPPVVAIPKRVSKAGDQTISVEGKQFTLPAGANIDLVTIAAHRNPKYWPTQPSQISERHHDLYDFKPERWLVEGAVGDLQQTNSTKESGNEDEYGGFTGQDTSARLFTPITGSYLPFSMNARSCLGRRLAQIEVMAVLAVVFQNHSIELAVDEWADDEKVAKMTREEKMAVYEEAEKKARATIRSATTRITLKLNPGHIPVRVVRRGEERFLNLID